MGCASAKHVATVQNEEEAQKGKSYQNGDVFGGALSSLELPGALHQTENKIECGPGGGSGDAAGGLLASWYHPAKGAAGKACSLPGEVLKKSDSATREKGARYLPSAPAAFSVAVSFVPELLLGIKGTAV
ncbi:hypothetical protein CB1_000115006 [Camelus ferus]|nr:hypothetical protein CB1_000115006 [Camelus ferus]